MTTTNTTLAPADMTTLQKLHAEMQELHNLTHTRGQTPSQELSKLTADLSRELQALSAQHSREIEELKNRQNLEMETVRNKDKAKRNELEKSIGAVNSHFKKESERISKEAKPLLKGISLAEVITLIPEEVRPTLIETADQPGKKMFILQHKLAPKCGFLIWADEGDSTKWSINLQNLLSGAQRHLVCFCGNGCMTNEKRDWLVNSLAGICKKHGITTLLGRKVGEDKDGVKFRDGGHFHEIAKGLPDNHLTKRSNYFVSLRG